MSLNNYDLYVADWPKTHIKAWNLALLAARAIENMELRCSSQSVEIGSDLEYMYSAWAIHKSLTYWESRRISIAYRVGHIYCYVR
jgi:hypothetical protein